MLLKIWSTDQTPFDKLNKKKYYKSNEPNIPLLTIIMLTFYEESLDKL